MSLLLADSILYFLTNVCDPTRNQQFFAQMIPCERNLEASRKEDSSNYTRPVVNGPISRNKYCMWFALWAFVKHVQSLLQYCLSWKLKHPRLRGSSAAYMHVVDSRNSVKVCMLMTTTLESLARRKVV